MADNDQSSTKDKDGKLIKKPDAPIVDPKSTEKDTKGKADDENITLSKTEFTDWQNKMVKLEEKVEKAESDKDKLERDTKFDELKALNPKLAKLNEKAASSTLDTVIATAKTMKGTFPPLNNGEDPEPAKPVIAGYRLLGSDEWITDNLM